MVTTFNFTLAAAQTCSRMVRMMLSICRATFPCSVFTTLQKVDCTGSLVTFRMPVRIGSRAMKRNWFSRGKPMYRPSTIPSTNRYKSMARGIRLDVTVCSTRPWKPSFLQHGDHRQQSAVGGQIPTREIILRGGIDFIGFRRTALRALFSGRFAAILFSVCNNLGDLLGIGSAKRQLRKLLFYPNFYGVPKWFTMHPPSRGKPQVRIGQVSRFR